MERRDLTADQARKLVKQVDKDRSGYYKYYTDPSDLFREIEQDFLDRIPAPPQVLNQQNQEALLTATSDFFDFIKENRKTFRILFNDSSGNSFTARLVEFLCNGYVPVSDTDERTSRFIQIYIANGTVGMMREWINTGFQLSSQDLAEMMYFLSKKISQY